jgi:hypothetical protein
MKRNSVHAAVKQVVTASSLAMQAKLESDDTSKRLMYEMVREKIKM